jgi:hypothetical protein
MQPATIICENLLADNARCGEVALVRGARYVHDRLGRPDETPVLREVQYRIECPRCGTRTQVERFD